jgi:hypothetical protein
VQYGLKALNSGAISKAEFLDLNDKIGGYDIDGHIIPTRTVGDAQAITAAYRSGVLDTAQNLTLPIIDTRTYRDPLADIHTRIRTFAKLDRLQRTNGTIANEVNWLTPITGSFPNIARLALPATTNGSRTSRRIYHRIRTPSRSFATSRQRSRMHAGCGGQ